MAHHRFRELVEATPSSTPVANNGSEAFVACPMFVVLPVAQQTWVQQVYQMAAEQTRRQMAPPKRASRMPAFSVN